MAQGKTFYAGDKTLKTGTLEYYKYAYGNCETNSTSTVSGSWIYVSGLDFKPEFVVVLGNDVAHVDDPRVIGIFIGESVGEVITVANSVIRYPTFTATTGAFRIRGSFLPNMNDEDHQAMFYAFGR